MVKDIAFKEFMEKAVKETDLPEETQEIIHDATLYAAIKMEEAIRFLTETHSASPEVYTYTLAALILSTTDNLDESIFVAKEISKKIQEMDTRYNKSG